MPFELIGRNTTVRGEFNRAIITPKWLAKQEIVPRGDFSIAVSDGADMPRLFKFAGFEWMVAHDRLIVKSIEPRDDDPGPKVAQVLNVLHHTPVVALGHNFLFESTELDPSLEARLGDRAAARIADRLGHELRKSTCEVVVSTGKDGSTGEDSLLTVKVVSEHPKQIVDLNFHFVTSDAKAAAQAAEKSAQCREQADKVLKVLMGHSR